MGAFEIQKLKIIPLLLQTGYLTIDKVVQRYDESFFMLKFPNYEVEKSFYLDLSEACSNIDADDVKKSVYNLIDN